MLLSIPDPSMMQCAQSYWISVNITVRPLVFISNKKCLFAEDEMSTLRKNLSKNLFDNYRKDFLPRLNESEQVKVSFDFELITIKDVVGSLLILFCKFVYVIMRFFSFNLEFARGFQKAEI